MADDPLKKKKPGSRKWREASRDRSLFAPRDAHGVFIPTNTSVGIDFICKNGHGILGQFRMSTVPDDDREVFMLALPATQRRPVRTLPEDAQSPSEGGKVLLVCDECGREAQYKPSRVRNALDVIWKPNEQRVVTRKV